MIKKLHAAAAALAVTSLAGGALVLQGRAGLGGVIING